MPVPGKLCNHLSIKSRQCQRKRLDETSMYYFTLKTVRFLCHTLCKNVIFLFPSMDPTQNTPQYYEIHFVLANMYGSHSFSLWDWSFLGGFTPCSKRFSQCFGGKYCHHLQGNWSGSGGYWNHSCKKLVPFSSNCSFRLHENNCLEPVSSLATMS